MATGLDQWEQELKSWVSHVQLIGELNLSREDTNTLSRLIAEFVQSYGPQNAIWRLRDRYPHCLAACLVFQGVYGYDEGDYWSGVCQALGLSDSPNYTQALGQAFEDALERLGLSHNFEGHRYVGAILGHGGIPTGSLPDFFEHVLHPSIERPELAGLSTREFIVEWLNRSYWYHVDKPVWRFLKNGEQIAEDFVERCRQMARAYQETGEVLPAEELGLPEAVVACYEAWIENPERTMLERRIGPRWARPGIVFYPWGEGVVALLPEQPSVLLTNQCEAWWEVDMGEDVKRIPVRARRIEMSERSEPVLLPLHRPAREYRIRLDVQQGPPPWTYPGVDEDQPFLVFDAKTGRLLPRPKALPGRSLWLLCPPDMQLLAEPDPRDLIRERISSLPYDWYTWSAYRVELSGLLMLVMRTQHRERRIRILEERADQRPMLVGGEKFDLSDDPLPLYIGRPPRLRIAWQRTDPKSRLSHWRLELRSERGADPVRDLKVSLDEFAGALHWGTDAVDLPLDHPTLLGATPIGQYHLRIWGPMAQRADLDFRIVPKLSVTGHEPIYLPDAQQGASPVQCLIETNTHSRLELLRGNATVHLQCISTDARGHCYQVDIAPEHAEVSLRLIRDEGGSVTFSIPIRRLRWQLVLHPVENRPAAWQSRAILVSLKELEESESPYLLVEAPGSNRSEAWIQLRFLDAEGTVFQEERAPSHSSRFHRFDLRRVRDSLRQSTSTVIRAELIVQGLPGYDTIVLPVLTVRREIYVEQATVAPRWEGDRIFLNLTWQPDLRLRRRIVRFWSQTRPWADPVELSLPDNVRGRAMIPTSADALPIGEYLVEFSVCDPWLPSDAKRPSPQAPYVVAVTLGDLAQRIGQLHEAIAQEGERFVYICERVFLWHALGDQQHAEQDFQWCFKHIEEATDDQMIALARAFEGHLDAQIILRRVFRPERVRQKLNAYERGELSEAELRSYLEQLPPISELSSATQRVLLDAPYTDIQFQAVAVLIEHDEQAGVDTVIRWYEQGLLPEQAAVELLARNVALAASVLANEPVTPVKGKLLDALIERHPEQVPVIRPSHWVRCQAGWGQIERIKTPDGQEIFYVHRDEILQRGYRLDIKLRAGESEWESAILDSAKREICLTRAKALYKCDKCSQFATANDRAIYMHDRRTHGGIGTSYTVLSRDCLEQTLPLNFSARRPSNIWQ